MSRLNPMTPRAVVLILFASAGALGAWQPALTMAKGQGRSGQGAWARGKGRARARAMGGARARGERLGKGPGPSVAAQQKPVAAPADAQERGRLLDLQRAAEAQLQQARRDGATADQIKKALLDASRSVGALGEANLDPALREELRRAAVRARDAGLRRPPGRRAGNGAGSGASRESESSSRRGRRAGPLVSGELQPDEAQGARVRRACVGDGAGAAECAIA